MIKLSLSQSSKFCPTQNTIRVRFDFNWQIKIKQTLPGTTLIQVSSCDLITFLPWLNVVEYVLTKKVTSTSKSSIHYDRHQDSKKTISLVKKRSSFLQSPPGTKFRGHQGNSDTCTLFPCTVPNPTSPEPAFFFGDEFGTSIFLLIRISLTSTIYLMATSTFLLSKKRASIHKFLGKKQNLAAVVYNKYSLAAEEMFQSLSFYFFFFFFFQLFV